MYVYLFIKLCSKYFNFITNFIINSERMICKLKGQQGKFSLEVTRVLEYLLIDNSYSQIKPYLVPPKPNTSKTSEKINKKKV